MSTRGFIGGKIKGKYFGKYNHFDNYYSGVGRDVLNAYFDDKIISGIDLMDRTASDDQPVSYQDKDGVFLGDGLFCEYAYVYNEDDDTLEIYRGFFKRSQGYCNMLDGGYKASDCSYYNHLVMVVDRKVHTKEQVILAMDAYEKDEEEKDLYPEHKHMPLCLGCFKPEKGYKHGKKCEEEKVVRAV